MKTNRWALHFAVTMGALAVPAACLAQDNAIVDLSAPGELFPSGVATLGFEFELPGSGVFAVPVVFGLGVFDPFPGPLEQDATVGLWDTSGDLLASATIPAGDAGYASGFFRFAPICRGDLMYCPYVLTYGKDYIIGAYEGAGGLATSLNTPVGGVGVYSFGNVIEDRFSSTSAFAFPDESLGLPEGSWLGANLQVAFVIDFPEPSTWALMLVGLGAVGASLRGRRRTATAGA